MVLLLYRKNDFGSQDKMHTHFLRKLFAPSYGEMEYVSLMKSIYFDHNSV